jgi:hypothetical protein
MPFWRLDVECLGHDDVRSVIFEWSHRDNYACDEASQAAVRCWKICTDLRATRPLNRAAVCARHSAGACSVSGFLPNEATQSSGGSCQAFCRGLQCVRLSAQRGHSIERRFVPGILPGLAVCQAFCPTRPLNRAAVCARHSAGACSVSDFQFNEATQSSGGLCQAFCLGLRCARLVHVAWDCTRLDSLGF